MTEALGPSASSGVWELRVGLFATQEQAQAVAAQVRRLLCPDPDHAPPCPIPWSTSLLRADDGAYEELREQARIEHGAAGSGDGTGSV